MIAAKLLILYVPTAFELALDYQRIVQKKKVDNHAADVWVRAIMMITLSIVCSVKAEQGFWISFLQSMIMSVALFWLTFDYILNWMIKRPILSLGTTSWLDQKIGGLPWLLIMFAKVWVFLCAIGVYFYWDLIFNN